jgi:GT2 family glycosyltransferase
MNYYSKIKGYFFMLMQLYREKGLTEVFNNIVNKSKNFFKPTHRTLTVENWLSFYQGRKEFVHEELFNGDIEKYPKISILILTYNNLDISKICLHSIYCNTTYPNFEVIVVDNASIDQTPSWLNEFAVSHHNMKVVLNEENLGFARGNNQAAHIATGEYLIFLNNDTIVTQGWIERLFAHVHADPNIGLIGPVTNSTGNEALIPVDYHSPEEMEKFADDRANNMLGQAFDIRMLAFYCVMARKETFEAMGGLDERFAVGMFEDDDLALRYQQEGMRVVCAEDVFIHHFQGASFNKLDIDHYNQVFEENRKKYEQKWGREWQPYQLRSDFYTPTSVENLTESLQSFDVISFKCNICGLECKAALADLDREKPSCACGSTVRSRAIVHLLSTELFGRSIALPDFPIRPDLCGWGMSDGGYSDLLSQKLGYVNTFYHKPPFLDIAAPLEFEKEGTLDFLISTEVFEHIEPPVSRAFINARRLLKPGGTFVFTVPYTLGSDTVEHFPELHQYEIIAPQSNRPILKNVTKNGQEQVYDDLIFHGGPGTTLEMRIFSKTGMLAELKEAGFDVVKIFSEPYLEFGIYWHVSWSLPLIAKSTQ